MMIVKYNISVNIYIIYFLNVFTIYIILINNGWRFSTPKTWWRVAKREKRSKSRLQKFRANSNSLRLINLKVLRESHLESRLPERALLRLWCYDKHCVELLTFGLFDLKICVVFRIVCFWLEIIYYSNQIALCYIFS